VGRLDWPTKLYLLEQAADAPLEQRKKIDIRYHELSAEGYFQQLSAAGVARCVVSDEEIDRAKRNPPSDTPAAKRGRYIREFSGGGDPLEVDWRELVIGSKPKRKVRLAE
jgi:proteasome accessory factor A